MKNYVITFTLVFVVLLSGCNTPDNLNKPKEKDLSIENNQEEKDHLKCVAKYLEVKENPNILVQITDKNNKNSTKKSFTVDEINKLDFEARMTPPRKGEYFSFQLCAGDKAISLDPLNSKFSQIPKDYESNLFQKIGFFDEFNLLPGTYQIYAYYSIDSKEWYVDGDKIEFEVTKNQNLSENNNVSNQNEIYVEAGDGKLNNEDKYSYMADFKRHGNEKTKEAYLGTGGANVEYDVIAPDNGIYELSLRLTDDALHQDNARNATISINGKKVHYRHKSENTNGWKWYSLGEVELKEGKNKVVITKDKSTSAAFIINAFKFTKK